MKSNHIHENCKVEPVLNVLFGKWKTSILYVLFQGTKRFGELQKSIPGITKKMLISHLRDLEDQDIIERIVYPSVPPRVEYALTEVGLSLEPILDSMNKWGIKHEEHLMRKHSNTPSS
ncbi:transcriptional regulator [Paenibacillus glycanilyticus]|uniref:Transcriptional regulator n=1 Tax=Paenibacillus glycanilyticus TaxID=126569 RepID=A0ABQ6NPQ4_9BACL|nr:helix-turn-helix domain-containing protein [Paenibacillus glycanilyticus]GMK47060.1 transcriptional regulator [Paenibacillus glycanilyticus]